MRDAWEGGDFDASFTTEYVARNSAAKGACGVYKEVIEINLDTFMEFLDEQ